MKKSILLLWCCIGTSSFIFAQNPARLFLQQKDTTSVGEQVCVQVFAADFQRLDSLQLSVRYAAQALQWEEIVHTAEGVEVIAQKNYDGLLRVTWKNIANAQGITINDSIVLFELCFKAIQPTFGNEYVALVNHPLPIRAFDVEQQQIDVVETNLDWIAGIHIFPGEEIYLAIEDTVVAPGKPFCRKIRLIHTDKPFISMQFSLAWNPTIIRLDSVINLQLPNLRLDRDFNLTILGQGKLSCLWQDDQVRGVTQDSISYLYEICFTALDSIGNSAIRFTASPTAIEFISLDFSLLRPYTAPANLVVDADPFMRPGDTNHDGTVDHFDLLNIGLGYGNIGLNRRNADLDWENQPVANWEQESPLSQTNYKHFDADGNGIIDLTDAQAIDLNWNQIVEDGLMENDPTQIRDAGAPLYVKTEKVFADGKPVTFDIILGEELQKAENIYGIAFSIEYDAILIARDNDTLFASFDASWLGQVGEDLLVFQKDNDERIDIALVRTDGQNRTGFGTIAQLNFLAPTYTGEIPTGTDTIGFLPFRIKNVRAIDFAEMEQVTSPMETMAAVDVSTSTIDPLLAGKVQVFPNPANNVLNIRTNDVIVEGVTLYNVNGQVISQSRNSTSLSIEHLEPGLYFCKIQTNKGFLTKQVTIAK